MCIRDSGYTVYTAGSTPYFNLFGSDFGNIIKTVTFVAKIMCYKPSLDVYKRQSFDYEDYRRHQGVRHPRTVVAVTEDKDLLLVTIDGRWAGTVSYTHLDVYKRQT